MKKCGNMPKVVITDYTFPNLDIEKLVLEPIDCELSGHQCRTPEALIKVVRDADHVLTQFAPVNADVVNAMERAKVIVRYGIGYDNVDLTAAAARRCRRMSTPALGGAQCRSCC